MKILFIVATLLLVTINGCEKEQVFSSELELSEFLIENDWFMTRVEDNYTLDTTVVRFVETRHNTGKVYKLQNKTINYIVVTNNAVKLFLDDADGIIFRVDWNKNTKTMHWREMRSINTKTFYGFIAIK